MSQNKQKARTSIVSEHGWDESCGNFGVKVKRTQSKFDDCASIEVIYDDFLDDDCTHHRTQHRTVVSWDGGEVSGDYVEKLLNFVHVPEYVQNVSAFNMILRLVDVIRTEKGIDGEAANLDSISVSIMTDRDTADYSEFNDQEA